MARSTRGCLAAGPMAAGCRSTTAPGSGSRSTSARCRRSGRSRPRAAATGPTGSARTTSRTRATATRGSRTPRAGSAGSLTPTSTTGTSSSTSSTTRSSRGTCGSSSTGSTAGPACGGSSTPRSPRGSGSASRSASRRASSRTRPSRRPRRTATTGTTMARSLRGSTRRSTMAGGSRSTTAPGSGGPRNGRLYGGGPYGCWLPQYNRVGEWIQADLGVPQPVGGVATQGLRHHTNAHMITTYNVVYSSDGNSWTPIMAGGARQNFRGNNDGDTVVSHIFDPPIIARFVRIVSTGKNGNNWPCARMELYKPHASRFNTGRLDSLGAGQGMEDGTIPDSKIRASSTFKDSNGDGYAAKYARLNSVAGKGAWAAATNNDKQWLQIETSGDFKVGGVAVQGRAKASGYRQWVTTYRVSVSHDGKKWTAVKNKAGHEAYFRGSSNSDGVVRSAFASPLEARFVRIEPMGWYTHISMRAEVYDTAARQAKLKAQREAAKKAAAQKAAKEKAALEARLAKEKAERAARLAAERAAKEKAERAALAAEHRAKLEKTKAAKDAATKAAADAAAKAKAFEAKIKALRDHKPKEVVEAEKRLVQLNAELTKIRTEADNINFDEEQYARTQRQIADVEEQIAAARTKRIRERLEIAERNAELSFKVQRLDKLRDGIEKLGGDVESILKKAKVDIGALMELVKANKAANSSSGSSGSGSSGSSSSGSSSAAAAVLA
eukprot:TRINITY_DN265_c0_g1_i6.p1 TRINITY_DN265_c0_g1~~TRINITY_DN265_c0_g1_i6.p1  ORF type:complete len:723 (-),score=272.82 TRINITY_DN265_c0_g1_i6:63-2231(-)